MKLKIFNLKYFKRFLSSFMIIIFCSLLIFQSVNNTVYADTTDNETRSIIGEYFSKVFDIELDDGQGLLDTQEDNKNRKKINDKIYKGTANKKYSLYDRFGSNIKFIPYFGEKVIVTGLLDKFYTAYLKNDSKFTLSMTTIKEFLKEPIISNNIIYDDRPAVLNKTELNAGNIDPRVNVYSGISATGGEASIGNIGLLISNIFTTIVAFLSGSGLITKLNKAFKSFCKDGLSDLLKSFVYFLLPLVAIAFVIKLVSKSFKVIKGNYSGRDLAIEILNVIISLGFIFSLMTNPMGLSDTLLNITSVFDSAFDYALTYNADEVVKSDNPDNLRMAVIWEKSVFNPWCEGMFQTDYKHLYTQYSSKDKKYKMPQSHDNIKDGTWDSNEIKYNSKELTGDISVPLGNNKNAKNWAALAWSCQSIYHIDAIKNKQTTNTSNNEESKEQENKTSNWPKATACPMNDQIYVDNFRWLDAKLNISPEYYSTDTVVNNYSNSNNYKQTFVSAGFKSIFMALLLLPIFVLCIRKFICMLHIITSGFEFIGKSLLSFFLPRKYNFINTIKSLIKNIYDMYWWSAIIFLGTFTYIKLTGGKLINDLIWIIAGIVLCKIEPIRTPTQVKNILRKGKQKAKETGNKIVNKTENLMSKKSTKK